MSVKSRRLPIFAIPLVISLLLGACYPSHRAPFVITSPGDNNTLPSNQPVTVRMSVLDLTHLNPGYEYPVTWDRYEYTVHDNGGLIADRTNVPLTMREPFEVISHPEDGAHWVEVNGRAARAVYSSGDQSLAFSPWYHEDVCFWVGPNPPPDFCSVRTIVQPIQPATPTASPIPPTPVPMILELASHPNPVYYGESCPAPTTVTLQAALAVPDGTSADLMDVDAHVSVLVGSSSNTVGSLLVPLESTLTWDASTGGRIFLGTIDFSHAYDDADNHFNPASLEAGSGAILWYVEVSRHDAYLQNAEFLERSPNQVIDLAPCPRQGQPGGQRPGGGSEPGGSESGCGQYGNQLSCNLAGCSWNPQDSICIVSP